MGARFGCGLGLCGACFVHVDGAVVPSCDTPLWSVEGKTVVTVEGLAPGDELHPVQQAMLDEQAAQCALLRDRRDHERGGAAGALAAPGPGRGGRGAGAQPVPVRRARPDGPGGAAGGWRRWLNRPCCRRTWPPTRCWPAGSGSARTAGSTSGSARSSSARASSPRWPSSPRTSSDADLADVRMLGADTADGPGRGPDRGQPVDLDLRAGAAGRGRQRAGAVRRRRGARLAGRPEHRDRPLRTVHRAGGPAQLVRRAGRPRSTSTCRPTPTRAGRGRRPVRRHRRAPARPAGQGRRPAPVRARPAAARPVVRPGGAAAVARRPAARARPGGGRDGVTRGPGRLVPRGRRPGRGRGAAGGRRGCGPRRSGPRPTRCRTRTTWTASCGPARTRRSRSPTTASTTAPRPAGPARRSRATYSRPFVAHASIAPSCAVARWHPDGRVAGVVAQPGHRQPGPGHRRRARPRPGDRPRATRRGRRLLRPQRAPTTSRSTRCWWPGRCRARRCRCCGAGRTS